MPVALILAAIALGTSALGAVASSIPSNRDEYRKWRLKQLGTLVNEGLTQDQEEQMRQMGLGSVQAQEREIRGRRADNLAALSGGATAQDIRAFEASDAERIAKARQNIDTEIIKQDQAQKQKYREEQNALYQEQEGRRKERTNAWLGVLDTAAKSAGTVAAATEAERLEGTGPAGMQGLQQSAARVYGPGAKTPSGMPDFSYKSPAVRAWWDSLSEEQQLQYAAQYK